MEEEIVEVKKRKHHFNFKRGMVRIIALLLAVIMVLAVAVSIIGYLR